MPAVSSPWCATANDSPSSAPNPLGSVGDSYDNALAETINGLYKTELIRRRGPWRNVDEVELATLEWVHWFNTARLHGALGDVPPDEFEAAFYAAQQADPAGVGIQWPGPPSNPGRFSDRRVIREASFCAWFGEYPGLAANGCESIGRSSVAWRSTVEIVELDRCAWRHRLVAVRPNTSSAKAAGSCAPDRRPRPRAR